MTWSFNPALPQVRDRVRQHIGDTNTADQQLTDEALDVLLVAYPNEYQAAQHACLDLAAKYARQVDRDVNQTTVHEGDRIKHYTRLSWAFRFRR